MCVNGNQLAVTERVAVDNFGRKRKIQENRAKSITFVIFEEFPQFPLETERIE